MSAAIPEPGGSPVPAGPLEALLADVLPDLNVELSSCYTNRSRGKWPWVTKHNDILFVDLPAAAEFWERRGRVHVAARLRTRAEALWAKHEAHRALAQKWKGAVDQ